MAKTGDSFDVTLKDTHIKWGTHRYTNTRDPIPKEVYLPIPAQYARQFELYNSNFTNHQDSFGYNLFTYDAFIGSTIHSSGILKTQGGSRAGAIYAKNLSGYNNLKMLSPWIYDANINVGDSIRITFTSSTSLTLHKI